MRSSMRLCIRGADLASGKSDGYLAPAPNDLPWEGNAQTCLFNVCLVSKVSSGLSLGSEAWLYCMHSAPAGPIMEFSSDQFFIYISCYFGSQCLQIFIVNNSVW